LIDWQNLKHPIQIFENGDCMDYMKTMPDNFIDLCICDPPYGINETGQRNLADRPTAKWRKPVSQVYKAFNDTEIPTAEYFAELYRISKEQIIWGANHFVQYLPSSKGWIVWDKGVDEKEYLSMCELAFSSFDIRVQKFEYLWAGFKKKEQIIRIHPTQKPLALYKWLLTKYAKEGNLILDTHVGSASSLIACEDMGFNYVGFELDKDYYEAAQKRLKQFRSQLKIDFNE